MVNVSEKIKIHSFASVKKKPLWYKQGLCWGRGEIHINTAQLKATNNPTLQPLVVITSMEKAEKITDISVPDHYIFQNLLSDTVASPLYQVFSLYITPAARQL